jgi:hypothetical protein
LPLYSLEGRSLIKVSVVPAALNRLRSKRY